MGFRFKGYKILEALKRGLRDTQISDIRNVYRVKVSEGPGSGAQL